MHGASRVYLLINKSHGVNEYHAIIFGNKAHGNFFFANVHNYTPSYRPLNKVILGGGKWARGPVYHNYDLLLSKGSGLGLVHLE